MGAVLIMKLIFGRLGGTVRVRVGCGSLALFQLVSMVAVRGCGEGVAGWWEAGTEPGCPAAPPPLGHQLVLG